MSPPPGRRSTLAGLAFLLATAAVVRFWGIGFGLPHTDARPDERAIIDVTRAFLSGNFTPQFFDYPWWFMWLLSALYLGYYVWGLATGAFGSLADFVASWPTAWHPFFLISRSLSAAAGAATVVPVFWIGRRLWDEATGLLAALFVALAFLHVRDSHFGTTDVTMTLFVMLSVASLVDAHQTGRRSGFALAGLFGGLAAATKYNALLLPVSMAASQIVHAIDSPGRRLRAVVDGRLAAYSVPFAAAFAVGVPFVVMDFEGFRFNMTLLWDSMMKGVGTPPPDINGWVHHLSLSLRYGLGWPMVAAGFGGVVWLAIRSPGTAAVLFSFPLAYFAVAGAFRNLFFRYVIPIVPFLCLAAAALVCHLARRVGTPAAAPGVPRLSFRWSAAVLGAVVLSPSAWSVVRFDRLLAATDNRVVVAEWFASHVPPGSSVMQSGSIYGYAQFERRLQYKQWMWDRGRRRFLLDGRTPEGQPDWILVQESPLPSETQDVVKEFLKSGYELAWRFEALDLKRSWHLYDRQDAFFVPFAGFSRVSRPGPNFTLYKRAGAPML